MTMLRVSFLLTKRDLAHFRQIMEEARQAAASRPEPEVVAAAEDLLAQVKGVALPDFVRERLEKLRNLVAMLSDEQWRIPELERRRVISALAYFVEPQDMIPDHIPGLGFLDDAIMVELVVRELRHEIEAYEEFCRFRDAGAAAIPGEEQLAQRRKSLQARMRRRSSVHRRRKDGLHLTMF